MTSSLSLAEPFLLNATNDNDDYSNDFYEVIFLQQKSCRLMACDNKKLT